MNIAFFIRNLAGGGAERVAVNLANELAKTHNVFFIVIDKSGPYLQLLSPQLTLVELGSRRLVTSMVSLAAALRRHKIDVLLSNLTHENIVAAAASLFSKVQLIAIEHNNFDREMADRGRLVHRITKILYRGLRSRVNVFVAVSEGVRQEISEHFPGCRIVAIHNPIIEERLVQAVHDFECGDQRMEERHGILFVGRLTEQKNPALALAVFKNLVENHGYSDDLTILGEGPLQNLLIEQAAIMGLSRRVKFAGFQKNPYKFMCQAQLIILTSRWEGFGNILVEGLYCGAKVVAYDCDFGPREIISDATIGRLVTSSDAAEFAQAVNQELLSESDMQAKRRRALQFSVQAVAQKYEQLFEVS